MERKRIDFYRKWNGKPLEDWGSVVSKDYASFQRCFGNILKHIATELGATLCWYSKGHYDETAMFERDGKFVYLSHFNDLYNRATPRLRSFLIRSAQHAKDYTGGCNEYANWPQLVNEMDRILGGDGKIEDVDKFPLKWSLSYGW